jgi:hypothetical protein
VSTFTGATIYTGFPTSTTRHNGRSASTINYLNPATPSSRVVVKAGTPATTSTTCTPASPASVTAGFLPGTQVISTTYRNDLVAYGKSLKPGASITIIGYAKGNAALAKNRAIAVEKLLKALDPGLKVTIQTNVKNTKSTVTIAKS